MKADGIARLSYGDAWRAIATGVLSLGIRLAAYWSFRPPRESRYLMATSLGYFQFPTVGAALIRRGLWFFAREWYYDRRDRLKKRS